MFNDGRVYVGSTCEELNPSLSWHLSNKKSQVNKNRKNNPKIELNVTAPSSDKESLENVESCYINKYAIKYKNKLINTRSGIRSNPLQ